MDPMTSRLATALQGRYAVEHELGQGGMALVYLAEDLRHGRKVALKVLKPELAAVVGADRFLAEIRTTANLQHPNILPLYDSGEADGFLFYVMPYIEGESLRDRLDRERQLPIDEALRIATDVAEALDAAHEQGVIHRDIKPANIMLSRGRPLVADFGIALAVSAAGGGRLTETGLSMGTPFYMSPEQATADRDPTPASDVYSLGCVLYEMLVGDPPHVAGSAQAVLAKILTDDAVGPRKGRASVPDHVDAAVRCALQKIPADRFGSAKAFAAALADPGFRWGPAPPMQGVAAGGADSLRGGAWTGTAKAMAGLAAVLGATLVANVWATRGSPDVAAASLAYVTLSLPDDQSLSVTGRAAGLTNGSRPVLPAVTFSPDGSTLVYRAEREGVARLYRRRFEDPQPTEIEGTEGAYGPFFSPDGGELGFWTEGGIHRVPIGGGVRVDVVSVESLGWGATWTEDGWIVFRDSRAQGLQRVRPSGTQPPEPVPSHPDARLPRTLPGQPALMYTVAEDLQVLAPRYIELLRTDTGVRDTLLLDASDAGYLSTGHLIFARRGQLLAVEFDLEALEANPESVFGVTPDVMHAMNGGNTGVMTDAAQYAVAPGTGHLVFIRGGVTPDNNSTLAVYDRSGRRTELDIPPRPYLVARFSPSGDRFLATVIGQNPGVWVGGFDRSSAARRVAEEGAFAAWGSDDQRVFTVGRDQMWAVDVSGGRPPVALEGTRSSVPAESRAGELLYVASTDDGARSIRARDPSSGEDRLILAEPSSVTHPDVSDDGRWLIYATGGEWVVRRYPDVDSGRFPLPGLRGEGAWGAGTEFIVARNDSVFTVPIDTVAGVRAGEPELLFTATDMRGASPMRSMDVSPDGRRFLIREFERSPDPEPITEMQVVLNWMSSLRR